MVSEGDDDRFFLDRQHRRLRILRPGRQIGNRAPLLPLCDGLLVDPIAFGEPPQALLTMLYRSTDRRCRRGAAVKNLSHSASFHSVEKTAPSKPGIKHLAKAKQCEERARKMRDLRDREWQLILARAYRMLAESAGEDPARRQPQAA